MGHFCFNIVRMKFNLSSKRHPPTFSLFLIILFLSACSSSGIKGVVERPNIKVYKVEMGNFNLSGGSAVFVLDVQNPNRFPIPLTGLSYGLRLNGVEVANGVKEQRETINAGESKKIEIPLRLSFANMINMLPGLMRDKHLNYELGGSVHLPWFNIPFQRTGSTNIQ
jgi:LEA14-like dessication related protein